MVTFKDLPIGATFRQGAGNFLWKKTSPTEIEDTAAPGCNLRFDAFESVRPESILVAVPLGSLKPGTKVALVSNGLLEYTVVKELNRYGAQLGTMGPDFTFCHTPTAVYVPAVTKPLGEFKVGDTVMIHNRGYTVQGRRTFMRVVSEGHPYDYPDDTPATAIPS